ncbi:MAG: TIGR00266 family protein [Chloroflexota bacterium]
MRYEIKGSTMPALEITLDRGESVFTEVAGMSWMTDGINMATGTRGGLGKIIGRAISGESMFLTTFKSTEDGARVVFTPDVPGQIIPVELKEGQDIIAQRDAFMCAEDGVDVKVHFRKKLGVGFFGGEGFVMQRLTGPGMMFAEIGGEVVEYELQRGEVLKVNPGYVAMHEHTVDYDMGMVGGVRNMIFGGEGVFVATLKGPGRVWLQTMPLQHLATSIFRYLPEPTIVAPTNEQKADDE